MCLFVAFNVLIILLVVFLCAVVVCICAMQVAGCDEKRVVNFYVVMVRTKQLILLHNGV